MRPPELCIQYRSESGACKIAATDVAKSGRDNKFAMRIAWIKFVEIVIQKSGEVVPDGFHKTVRVHWECPSNK